MSEVVSEEIVRQVACLARLRLTDAEVKQFSHDLSSILAYVAQLNEVDTADVPTTDHPIDVCNVFRDDIPAESLGQGDALGNAPESHDGFFKVPKVLEQGAM